MNCMHGKAYRYNATDLVRKGLMKLGAQFKKKINLKFCEIAIFCFGALLAQNSPLPLGAFESLHNFLNWKIIVAKNSSIMMRGRWLLWCICTIWTAPVVSNSSTRSKKRLALSNIPLDEWARLPRACVYDLSNLNWWILY